MIENAQIENILNFYKCPCNVIESRQGGGFIDYFLQPLNGTTLNKLQSRVNDFSGAIGQAVSIAFENFNIILRIKEAQKSYDYFAYRCNLDKRAGQIGFGINPRGEYVQYNLFTMPHLLVAGATGSGKSVFLHSAIISLMNDKNTKLRLIDLKRVELSKYNGINHLLSNAITTPEEAERILRVEVNEMEGRYQLMERCGVSNYKDLPANVALCARVIVIDELADLMLNRATRKSVENSIVRIAQLGRAAGMHLIVATQRPSTDVITGLIKANIPCKIAFMTSSAVDSRVIGIKGAEHLNGRGDALLSIAGHQEVERLQAFFISEETIAKLVKGVKEAQPKQAQTQPKQTKRGFWARVFG